MEIILYVYIWPGVDYKYICAYSNPGAKSTGCKRFKLTFDLPDPNEPDSNGELIDTEEVGRID